MARSFRYTVWDPLLLVLQIVSLQALYYTTLSTGFFLASRVVDAPLSLGLLFNERALDAWQNYAVFLINAFLLGGLIWLVVGRAKQCLDFSATAHIFHFMITVIYGGFPHRIGWWILQLLCTAAAAVTGEFVCMQVDMLQSIEVGGGQGAARPQADGGKQRR